MNKKANKYALSPPGELINVNGRNVHIQRGGVNSPTVVFEAGIWANSLYWAKIQPEISGICSTLSYDRAGMGYSDPSPTLDRSSSVIAAELFDLLGKMDLKEPLILVGWSAGGIYIRKFAHQHPDRVAGMVFIDSAHENSANRKPEEFVRLEREGGPDARLERFKTLSQLTHDEILKEVADSLWKTKHPDTFKYYEDQASPAQFSYFVKLWELFEPDTAQADDALLPLGDIPLVVISSVVNEHESLTDEQNKMVAGYVNGLQDDLASLSTNSRHIKVHSGHDIANEKPDIVIDAIIELVEQVRRIR